MNTVKPPLNTATKQLLAIAADIPCLARKMGVRVEYDDRAPDQPLLHYTTNVPWLVEHGGALAFDPDKFHRCIRPWSHGEYLCALFLLNVWNPGDAKSKKWHFNLMDFIGTADAANREGIIAWMQNPIFP